MSKENVVASFIPMHQFYICIDFDHKGGIFRGTRNKPNKSAHSVVLGITASPA